MAVKRLVGTGAFAFSLGIAGMARAQAPQTPPAAQFPAAAAAPAQPPPPYETAPGPAYTQYGAPPPYAPPPPPPPYPYYSAPPPVPPPPAEAPPSPPANWGIGAGLGFGDGGASGIPGVSSATSSYRLAMERRLGSSTWLTFNGSLNYQRTQQNVSESGIGSDPPRSSLELKTFNVSGLLGIRQVVVQSIVDVSLFGSAGIGHSTTSGEEPRENEYVSVEPGGFVNTLSFVAGLAVERRLVEGLAARISLGILSASTSRAERIERRNGERETDVFSTQSIGLSLSPALLLFFYF